MTKCKMCGFKHPKGTLDYDLTHDKKFSLLLGIVTIVVIILILLKVYEKSI